MPSQKSSLYPVYPSGTRILIPRPESLHLSAIDRFLVNFSSLFVVGSIAWVPIMTYRLYRKWKEMDLRCKQMNEQSNPNFETKLKQYRQKRKLYGTLLFSLALIAIVGPHRSKKVGEWFQVRKWRLWKAWLNYIAFEVVTDVDYSRFQSSNTKSNMKPNFDILKDQSVMVSIPHGIFPFSLAFAALPEIAKNAFGIFRPVVATATNFFPFVNMFLKWLDSIDASRKNVNQAFLDKARIGLSPGGISEMFEGYPNPPCTNVNDEAALIKSRKGFIRMAIQHQTPIVPVYCFGATKLLKRLDIPLLQKISRILKISICLFYGKLGLPIPFRQRLLYVMGNPIFPPDMTHSNGNSSNNSNTDEMLRQNVDEMHEKFCNELLRIFDKYKESYGWGDKILHLT